MVAFAPAIRREGKTGNGNYILGHGYQEGAVAWELPLAHEIFPQTFLIRPQVNTPVFGSGSLPPVNRSSPENARREVRESSYVDLRHVRRVINLDALICAL
jgi:hypothetical protein